MKEEGGIRPGKFSRRGPGKINSDFVVFAFFLLLSFILWYLNSLGKEVEAGIKYEVKYTNLPKEREISDELPADLILFLKGPGYSILKLKISGNKPPVNIDISKVNYKRTPGNRSLNYFIVTSGLTKSLNIQMRTGCEITSIKPDTLFFTMNKIMATTSEMPVNRLDSNKK